MRDLWTEFAHWLNGRMSAAFEDHLSNAVLPNDGRFWNELVRRTRVARDAILIGPTLGMLTCVIAGVAFASFYVHPRIIQELDACQCPAGIVRNGAKPVLLGLWVGVAEIAVPFLVAALKLVITAMLMSVPVNALRVFLSRDEKCSRECEMNLRYEWWWERYERTIILPAVVLVSVVWLVSLNWKDLRDIETSITPLLWICTGVIVVMDIIFILLQRQWGWIERFGSKRVFRSRIASVVTLFGDFVVLGILLNLAPGILGTAVSATENTFERIPSVVFADVRQLAVDFADTDCIACVESVSAKFSERITENALPLAEAGAFMRGFSALVGRVFLALLTYLIVSTLVMHIGWTRAWRYLVVSIAAILTSRLVIGLVLSLYGMRGETGFATVLAVVVGGGMALFFARYREGLID